VGGKLRSAGRAFRDAAREPGRPAEVVHRLGKLAPANFLKRLRIVRAAR